MLLLKGGRFFLKEGKSTSIVTGIDVKDACATSTIRKRIRKWENARYVAADSSVSTIIKAFLKKLKKMLKRMYVFAQSVDLSRYTHLETVATRKPVPGAILL
jgi:hypothetical protein